MASAAALALVLLLAVPGRRRRAAGLAVRRSHALVVLAATALNLMPVPWALRSFDPLREIALGAGDALALPPEVNHYHLDHLGSTTLVTDDAGNARTCIRYKAYGEVRGRYAGCSTTTTPAVEQEYEFTGYETDALSGLQYAGARYYDPVLGTFLTHDPKRVTPNPYSYANWDPVNMVDPNGMEPFTIVGAIVVFAIGSAIGFTTAAIRAFMNGATWGEALEAGAISGAISGATAVVGAYVLQPAVGLAVAKLVSESATHLASALLFASSLAQAGYGISQNDYTGIIGLGLSVGVGWAFASALSDTSAQSGQGGLSREGSDYGMSAQRGAIGVEGDVSSYDAAISYLREDAESSAMIDMLESGERGEFTVKTNSTFNNSYEFRTRTLNWDPRSGLRVDGLGGGIQTAAFGLGHELAHVAGPRWLTTRLQAVRVPVYDNLEEMRVIYSWEAPAAGRLGEPVRYNHWGTPMRVGGPLHRN